MRSQFLTVLCILTFLSCAWGVLDATVSLLKTDTISETTYVESDSKVKGQKEAPKQYYEDRSSGNEPLPNDPDLIRQLAIGQLVYSLLTLAGAILMFRLQRVGFWVYVAGVAVGLILPVVLAGFVALNISFGVFFSILFAILYWNTLKDMR
ncbi:hypothetical protein [Spirosoma sp. KNUC1025]|uniref:hypothetical protein n=1 Tax=Spirosoma sp. KNUC1025 TaxID=2894082 RepID=UPI00386AF52C|nr:hypothetical protein LN737_00310 [Spirosoma sp. KNUC1025]